MKSNYGFVVDKPADVSLGGRFSGSESYIAPLYIYNTNGDYDENGTGFLFKDGSRTDNFTKAFRRFLKEKGLQEFSPEQILGYIYAILFCPAYREAKCRFLP